MSSVIESLKPAIVRGAFVASVNTLMSPRVASDCHEGVSPDSRAAILYACVRYTEPSLFCARSTYSTDGVPAAGAGSVPTKRLPVVYCIGTNV